MIKYRWDICIHAPEYWVNKGNCVEASSIRRIQIYDMDVLAIYVIV